MENKTEVPKDYKKTNYTFQGIPVYRHEGLYVLASGQFVFRADLEKIKK